MKKLLLFVLLAYAGIAGAQDNFGSAQPFRSGDVVTFVGDSITHGGSYHSVISLFYATRFPDRQIRYYNCGIGGDRASTIMSDEKFRVNVDILGHKPTVATIMLGMNDVGRPDYAPGKEGPEVEKSRQRSLEIYDQNMVKLIGALQKSGARLILITPSIYDETTKLEKANPVITAGGNGAIGKCAEKVRQWSKDFNTGLVEFYAVMNAINEREQKKDPTFTIVGPDRVHPGWPGHFVMAYTLLKAQGMPREVARIAVNAGEPGNCQIEKVKSGPEGLEFDVLEKSLPLVVPDAAKPALQIVPFMQDLNQETFVAGGLAAGRYLLKIDGETVGEYDADELKKGVNLAENSNTPQYKQSEAATRIMLERTAVGQSIRSVAAQMYGWSRGGVDVSDRAVVEKRFRDRAQSDKRAEAALKSFLEFDNLQKQYDELNASLIKACQPVKHRFSLVKR